MQTLTRSEIQKLTQQTYDPAVSLFMRVDPEDYTANRERFRTLLTHAREELTNLTTYELRHEALYPAYRLLHDREWWRGADKSVAVFTAPGYIEAFHLADEIDDTYSISRNFNIIPLLSQLNTEGTFYILALSQRHTRLLWSDHQSVNELEIAGLPHSIEEMAEGEDGNQSATSPKSYLKRRDGRQVDIFKFLHQIDSVITPVLKEQKAPLVLAGLPHMVALFRKLSHYNHVVNKSINRNVDRLNNTTLGDRAWVLVEDYFKADERLARSQLERLEKTQPKRVVRSMKRIMEAVQQGKVQTLFVDAGAHIWGKFNIPAHRLTVHQKHMPGDADLLNLVVSETLNRSGNVFALDSDHFPQGVHSIAILRY